MSACLYESETERERDNTRRWMLKSGVSKVSEWKKVATKNEDSRSCVIKCPKSVERKHIMGEEWRRCGSPVVYGAVS